MAENRRVKMTKKLMKDAVLELLETKAPDKITVTDICGRADVNRSTFYAYYEDIGQLLLEIEDDALSQLPSFSDSDFLQGDVFLSSLESFFDYVRENERLFKILIIQHDSSSFNQRLVEAVMEKYSGLPRSGNSETDRYMYIFCVSGVIGVMREWISGGFVLSSRKFAEIVLRIATNATM